MSTAPIAIVSTRAQRSWARLLALGLLAMCLLTPVYALDMPSPSQGQGQLNGTPDSSTCANSDPTSTGGDDYTHPKCSTCKGGYEHGTTDQTIDDITCHSLIDSTIFRFTSVGIDYSAVPAEGAGGCSSCGGRSGKTPEACQMENLEIVRLHRPDAGAGSFGPGVFSQFDIRMAAFHSMPGRGDVLFLYDPSTYANQQFDLAADGTFYASGPYAAMRALYLYDASGATVTNFDYAASVVVVANGGTRFELEVVGGGLNARLTRVVDRNGNAITVTYQLPASSTESTASKLKIATVQDPYGRVASFTYAATTIGGRYVVSRIDLPTGQHLEYAYDDPNLTGLSRVTHPDGAQSTFTLLADPASQTVIYRMFDVADSTGHRQRDLYLSTPTWTDPVTAEVKNRSTNRARMETIGGEIVFLAWQEVDPTSSVHLYSYVYKGGGSLFRYETYHGAPRSLWRATSWSLSTPQSSWTWEVVNTYETDNQNRLKATTKSDGRKESYQRDAKTHRRTRVDKADGTYTTATYTTWGDPLEQLDEAGRITRSTYDAQGNRLSLTVAADTADASTMTWTYNARGQVVEERGLLYTASQPDLHVTTYGYNTAGYLTSITESADVAGGARPVSTFTYDAAGRRASVTDPVNQTTSFLYDSFGRLVRTTYADASYETTTYGTGADSGLVVARRDRNGVQTTIAYDASGRAQTTVQAAGTAVAVTETFAYLNGTKLPLTVTRAGSTTTYTYDHNQRRVATTVQPRVGTQLTTTDQLDPWGQRLRQIDPFGRSTWWVYDTQDRPIRQVRELVPGATGLGSATASQLAALSRDTGANPGYVIEDTVYDLDGEVLAHVDARGIRTTFAYDARGRLLSQTEDANGAPATTSFTYDVAGNRVSVASPRGVVTHTSYTGRNLPYQVTEAYGTLDATLVSTTTYSPTSKPLTVTDALGRTTVYTYGTCCDRLVGITDPAGFANGFTYDHMGNRLTVLDPNGLITTTTYDARRRVATATNAAGETTAYAYDDSLIDGVGIDAVSAIAGVLPTLGLGTGSAGSAVAVTDPSGATTYDLRDALGRSVARIDALGHATIIAYDTVVGGLIETAMTDALGHTTRSRADGANRVRQQVDALGNIATASYDAAGNQLAQRDATNVGWNASYDSRNRLIARSDTRTTGGGSTSWTYDLEGNRLSETDALGHTETSAYDLRNRRVTLTDRLGGITRFAYDAVGNLVQIADADNTAGLANLASSTQYAYDARNLLVAEAFPTGQTGRTLRAYAYDAGRRLTGRNVGILSGAFGTTPAFAGTAEVTTYAYDNANRLTIRGYADGRNDTFTYDQAGRLLTATSARYGGNVVARGYDAAGRLLNEALTLPGGTLAGTTVGNAVYTVGYAYDAANRLTSLTYPDGQGTVTRGYTDRNELATVAFGGGSVATRAYDAGGRLLTTTFGNGAVETRGYVPGDNLVASLATASGGTALVGFGYTYDADKRKLTETDQISSQTQAFGYDNASRLTSWNRTGVTPSTQSWNLSLVGDWTSTTRDGVAEPRVNTAVHEAVQVGSNLLTYDAKGNLTRDEHQTGLSWDPENRLISARVTPDASDSGFGAVAGYQYDALGRRIAKTVNGVTTVFINAGAQTVVELVRPAIPSQASINGTESDGTLANAALPPASGGILPGSGVTRVNFQPSTTAVPAGFLADSGKISAVRTNGMTYGWSSDATSQAVARHGAVPLAEFDTFVQAQPDAGGSLSWSIALPNGTYPVVVVAGDALSRNQTNNLVVGGANTIDTTPAATDTGYEAGNFDGYAVQANVTDGVLTITPAAGAFHAKLCFVEIGAIGTAIDMATQDRLAALIAKANAQTGANPEPGTATKTFVYGSYVDEVVAYQQTVNGVTTRYYPHYNHLYSVAALTNAAGQVVEKYTYNAYGTQTITSATGVVRQKSAVGWDRGFTGYVADSETGLDYARARQYSPGLGRFIGRDPVGYKGGGYGQYAAYFIPNLTDPSGLAPQCDYAKWPMLYAMGYTDLVCKPDGWTWGKKCGGGAGLGPLGSTVVYGNDGVLINLVPCGVFYVTLGANTFFHSYIKWADGSAGFTPDEANTPWIGYTGPGLVMSPDRHDGEPPTSMEEYGVYEGALVPTLSCASALNKLKAHIADDQALPVPLTYSPATYNCKHWAREKLQLAGFRKLP